MKLKFGEILRKGIAFGITPQRWLPIFVVDFVFFSILVLFVMGNDTLLLSLLGIVLNPRLAGGLPHFTGLVALGVMWILLKIWVIGAVVHQSYRARESRKSWHMSSERYHSLLGALGISFLIVSAAFAVPFLGIMLAALAWAAVSFSLQAVIVRKRPAFHAIRDSYSIFRKQFDPFSFSGYRFFLFFIASALTGALAVFMSAIAAAPVFWALSFWAQAAMLFYFLAYSRIFRIWFLVAVVSWAVALAFSIPVLVAGLLPVLNDPLLGSQGLAGGMVLFYFLNPNPLLIAGTVFLVGWAIATAFTLKVQADVYRHFRKSFWGF